MNESDYVLFANTESGIVSKALGSKDNFKAVDKNVDLDKVPYAVLCNQDDEDMIDACLFQRDLLNSLVFKADSDLTDASKDYSWDFNGRYLKPSKDVIDNVIDLRESTLWFCINRVWYESKRNEDESLIFIIPREYDEEKGFDTTLVNIPANLINKCNTITEVKALIHTYIRMHPTTLPQEV